MAAQLGAKNRLHAVTDRRFVRAGREYYRELGDFDAATPLSPTALRAKVTFDAGSCGALVATQRYATLDHPDVEQLIEHFRRAKIHRARAASGSVWPRFTMTSASTRRQQTFCVKPMRWFVASRHGRAIRAHRLLRSREQSAAEQRQIALQTAVDWTPIFVVGLAQRHHADGSPVGQACGSARPRRASAHSIHRRSSRSERPRPRSEALREAADLYSDHLRQDDAPALVVDNNQLNSAIWI
jgi:hypothetical protein